MRLGYSLEFAFKFNFRLQLWLNFKFKVNCFFYFLYLSKSWFQLLTFKVTCFFVFLFFLLKSWLFVSNLSHREIKFISLLSWQVDFFLKKKNYYYLICVPLEAPANIKNTDGFRFGILGLGWVLRVSDVAATVIELIRKITGKNLSLI